MAAHKIGQAIIFLPCGFLFYLVLSIFFPRLISTAEIGSGVWGTPANFNGIRVLAALLHSTPVVGVSQILRR